MITIGFTGTRNGMTETQKRSVSFLVSQVLARCTRANDPVMGLHGDCLGADADFDAICRHLGVMTGCRPCTFENMRANTPAEELAEPVRPMERNRAIVADATVMIACPPNRERIKSGSGTWATIGFAEKAGKPLAICWPDGDYAIDFRSLVPWCMATHGDEIFVSERGSGGE